MGIKNELSLAVFELETVIHDHESSPSLATLHRIKLLNTDIKIYLSILELKPNSPQTFHKEKARLSELLNPDSRERKKWVEQDGESFKVGDTVKDAIRRATASKFSRPGGALFEACVSREDLINALDAVQIRVKSILRSQETPANDVKNNP